MTKQACSACIYYREPNCRRYPRSMAVQAGWWCGEYKYRAPKKEAPKPNLDAAELVKAYCDEFKDRFGETPIIQGPDAQAAKNMIRDLGLEKSQNWVTRFLDLDQMPKWNREKRLMSLRHIPAAINQMATFDD